MKKFGAFVGGLGLMCALSSSVEAHDPPDYLGIIWQWPADKLPVTDGNISEWNVIPDEFWLTDKNFNVQSCLGDATFAGDLDPSNLSFRWTMGSRMARARPIGPSSASMTTGRSGMTSSRLSTLTILVVLSGPSKV